MCSAGLWPCSWICLYWYLCACPLWKIQWLLCTGRNTPAGWIRLHQGSANGSSVRICTLLSCPTGASLSVMMWLKTSWTQLSCLSICPKDRYDSAKEEFAQKLGLTKREREILDLLLKDMTNQEISGELVISLGTVKTHVHNILQKAEVTKRTQLMEQFRNFVQK